MLLSSKDLKFDSVTNFRLLNAYLVAIGINLFAPILIDLKGEYLLPWVISVFMIAEILSVKTNKYLVKLSLDSIYKLSTVLHLLFTIVPILYFTYPGILVYIDAVLSILVTMIFSVYSILLNNYLTENYPKSVNDFQITRNNTWANGTVIGLLCTTTITGLISIEAGVLVFMVYNICFSIWLFSNWNFYNTLRI